MAEEVKLGHGNLDKGKPKAERVTESAFGRLKDEIQGNETCVCVYTVLVSARKRSNDSMRAMLVIDRLMVQNCSVMLA